MTAIAEALRREYGEPEWSAERARPVLDQVLHTLLSQRTTSALCRLGFERLIALGPWEVIRVTPLVVVEEAIRPAGLAEQKATRVLQILDAVHDRFGACSLEALREWPDVQVIEFLRSLPGVGPKTAACVLLFALGRPALPVDTHVWRVTRRLGLLDEGVSMAKAQQTLESVVPPAWRGLYHVGLYEHGRRVCVSRRPRCESCVLGQWCVSHPGR